MIRLNRAKLCAEGRVRAGARARGTRGGFLVESPARGATARDSGSYTRLHTVSVSVVYQMHRMDVLGALMSVRATLGSRWKGLFLSIFSQAPQAELASVPAQSSPNYEARLTTERQAVDVIDWANMLSTAALHCA